MSLRTQLLALRIDPGNQAPGETVFTRWNEDEYPGLDMTLKTISNYLLDVATQYRDEAESLHQRTHRVIPLEIAGALEALSRTILDKDHAVLTQGELDREAAARDAAEVVRQVIVPLVN